VCVSLLLRPFQVSNESNQPLDYGAGFSQGLEQDARVVQVPVLLFPGCWAPYLIPWVGPNRSRHCRMDGSRKRDRSWGGAGSRSSQTLVFTGNSPLSWGIAYSCFGHSDLGNLGPSEPWPPIMALGMTLATPCCTSQPGEDRPSSSSPLAQQPAFPRGWVAPLPPCGASMPRAGSREESLGATGGV